MADLENLGTSAGVGLLASIFSWLITASGYKKRLEKVETDFPLKQDITVCEAHHVGLQNQIGDIRRSQDVIFGKLDRIYDHLIGEKR